MKKMKTLFFYFFILSFILSFSQEKDKSNSIHLSYTYGSNNAETDDILRIQSIDYFKLKFKGKDLIDKNFMILSKEIWNGKITKTDTLINTSLNENRKKIETDTLNFEILASNFKTHFIFSDFTLRKDYKSIVSDDYSLRILSDKKKFKILPNKRFILGAYILPYSHNGFLYWCSVEDSGIDVFKWGDKFDIEHYLVYEMMFF